MIYLMEENRTLVVENNNLREKFDQVYQEKTYQSYKILHLEKQLKDQVEINEYLKDKLKLGGQHGGVKSILPGEVQG